MSSPILAEPLCTHQWVTSPDDVLRSTDGEKCTGIGPVLYSLLLQCVKLLQQIDTCAVGRVRKLLLHQRDQLAHDRIIDGLRWYMHRAPLGARSPSSDHTAVTP